MTELILDLLVITTRSQPWVVYCLDCLGLAERFNQQCQVRRRHLVIRHAVFQTAQEVIDAQEGKPVGFLPLVKGRAEIALFLFGFDNLSPAGRCLARFACLNEKSHMLWNEIIERVMTQRDSLTVSLDVAVSEFVNKQQVQRAQDGRYRSEVELAGDPNVSESEAVAVVLYLRQIHPDLRRLVPFLREPRVDTLSV